MRYYDIGPIRARGCDYNFIFSGRGPGKSTAVVNMLIDAMADGGEFVRISRYDWEVSAALMSAWFNEVNAQHVRDVLGDYTIGYKGGKWYLEDSQGNRSTVGHSVTLNNQDVFKSASYDRVTNVVFEEFAQMNDRDYIRNEIELFLSALSTVVRNRKDVRVWFIGNTLSKHNPYFDFFGIDIDRLGITPGTIRTFRCNGFAGLGATVAIEYANMSHEDISEISPLMRVGGNITATSGLYAVQPSVSEFADRTRFVLDDDYTEFLPGTFGVYLGNGEFGRVRVTRYPRYDDMPLLCIDAYIPDVVDLHNYKWLNLSGTANPQYTWDGVSYPIRTVSPYPILADTRLIRRIREYDGRCVHAFETDEMRYKWRNFVDGYGYDLNEV